MFLNRHSLTPLVALLAMAAPLCAQFASPWMEYDGHYYRLTEPMSWLDAEYEASQVSGHLASINAAAEGSALFTMFDVDNLPGRSVYIGFNDLAVEGTFVWSSGEPVTYTNWQGGEPNDAPGFPPNCQAAFDPGEDATMMGWGGTPRWWDAPICYDGQHAIVEIDFDPALLGADPFLEDFATGFAGCSSPVGPPPASSTPYCTSDNGLWSKIWWDWTCVLHPDNVAVAGDLLTLTVQTVAGETTGAQVNSTENYGFGRYRARLQASAPTNATEGVVNGFFWYRDGVGEIDIEIRSHRIGDPAAGETSSIDLVVHDFTTQLPNQQSHVKCHFPLEVDFDPSADIHTYGFDFHPDRVEFFIDPETSPEPVATVYASDGFRIPQHAGSLILNNWTDTDDVTTWAGDPPTDGPRNLVVEEVSYTNSFALAPAPWANQGHGLAGLFGEPCLTGSGSFAPGAPYVVMLGNAREDAAVYLIWSLDTIDLPFLGGTLVPNLFTGGIVIGQTDDDGVFVLQGVIPNAAPVGLTGYFQGWVTDTAGPYLFASSNALRGTVADS